MWHVYGLLHGFWSRVHGGFPLASLPLALWFIDSSLRVVKALQFALILTSFVLFGRIVARTCSSRSVALLAVLFTLACWQFRSPHDPVIGTSLILPWAACTIFYALDRWQRYTERHYRRDFVLAIAATVLAGLTTPYAIILAVIFSATALQSRAFFRAGATLAVLSLATVAGSYAVTPNALPWLRGAAYVRDVALGIFSALPTSFRADSNVLIGHVPALYHFGPTGWRYVDDRFITIPPISMLGWVLLGALLVATWLAFRARKDDTTFGQTPAYVVGLSCWIVPALLINDPSTWHQQVPIGQAFDGVYFEYFGLGFVLALIFLRLHKGFGAMSRILPTLAALFFLVAAYGNLRVDAIALQHFHRSDRLRSIVERAGSAHFFAALPPHAHLLVTLKNIAPFDDGHDIANLRYLLYHYSKRRFSLEIRRNAGGTDHRNVWIFRVRNDEKLPLILAHVAKGNTQPPGVDHALGYTPIADAMTEAVEPKIGVTITADPLSDGWRLVARRTCGAVVPEAAFVEDRPTIHWTGGFSQGAPVGYHLDSPEPRPSGLNYSPTYYPKWYFAKAGTLVIKPSACSPETIDATLQAIATGPGSLWVTSQGTTQRIPISTVLTTFSIRLHAPSSQRLPIAVFFRTDAPAGNLTPLTSRYERDVPRGRRVMIEPATFVITPMIHKGR